MTEAEILFSCNFNLFKNSIRVMTDYSMDSKQLIQTLNKWYHSVILISVQVMSLHQRGDNTPLCTKTELQKER